jgi:Na+-translocating ferredoxin:NAD+ oxidoreductase RnfE subunit
MASNGQMMTSKKNNRPCMNEATNVTKKCDALTPLRHLVLAAMAAFIHPFWLVGFSFGLQQSIAIFIGSILIATAITGFAYLFFTQGTGRDWRGNFYRSLWTITALVLMGSWIK